MNMKHLLPVAATLIVASGSAMAGTGTGTVNVSMNIVPQCTITAANVDMGELGLMKTNTDKNGLNAITLKCTANTPYAITLQDAADPTNDNIKLKDGNGNEIDLLQYQDTPRTVLWNSTNAKSGTSNGSTGGEAFSVYLRVPAQAAKPAGAYSVGLNAVVSF